jgi:hypothetical protein
LARSFWDSNINKNLFPVQGYKREEIFCGSRGSGGVGDKIQRQQKTLGLFQFLPSTLLPGRPLSHLLFCCPHTFGPHTSLGLCPCQPSLNPFQLLTQVQKEVYRILLYILLHCNPNIVKICQTVLLSSRCYSIKGSFT